MNTNRHRSVVLAVMVLALMIFSGYLALPARNGTGEVSAIENERNGRSDAVEPQSTRAGPTKGIYFVTGTISSYGYGNGQHSKHFIINTFDWLWPTHAGNGPILLIWDHRGWSDGWRSEMNSRNIPFTQISAGNVNQGHFDPANYRMIIISEYQPNQFMTAMENLVPAMESYVNSGGILIDMFGTNYQRRWSGNVPGPYGVRTNGNNNGNNFVVAVNHPMVRNMNRPSFSGSSASHGEITTIPQGSDILLTVGVNQGGTPVACWLEVDLVPYTDNAALTGEDDEDVVCYARLKPYTFTVNVTSAKELNQVSEVKVYLDYNTTNATFGYDWGTERFFKLQDVNDHVNLLRDNCTVATDNVERWWLNFTVIFNFTFPHENPVDCYVLTRSTAQEIHSDRFPRLFRVENDLEFMGTPDLSGEYQGPLARDDWIRGGENITVSNLTVIYAGSPGTYPDDGFFDVRITDGGGEEWWDNESSREEISVGMIARNVTDTGEEYFMEIVNIPTNGICVTNLTFPLKIDAEPPEPPGNLICHADDFKGRETEHTNEPEMFVTWDPVEDVDSGLWGYYYSRFDDSGTEKGNFTNLTEVDLDRLDEGFAPIYVWCVDMVGNIGNSSASGILVDRTPPVFSNHTPSDGSWHNHTDITCSVEIFDGEGSGVDGKSVEYSVSTGGMMNFNLWMPAGLTEVAGKLVPEAEYFFTEGEENYIKWRAKDISGNGYVESFPVNIKVDVTPVKFAKEITPAENWYDTREITTMITISDQGIGVDLDRLDARISTTGSGASDFGEWMGIDAENITELNAGEYEIKVTYTYDEGKDNHIMFRGTDLVGNSYTVSGKFNLKIDTSPVYFGSFSPDNDTYSDEREVECFMEIFDDGSGVDAASVEYSVAAGGSGEDDFGPWKKAPNVVPGNPAQVLMAVEFEWGRENYIRWRAGDILSTGLAVSSPYRIWVNSEPVAVISYPVPGDELWHDEVITFDGGNSTDQDGDGLYFFWSSNVTANRTLGSGTAIARKLAPGWHSITLYVTDRHGYNVTDKIIIEVKEREVVEGPRGGGDQGGSLLSGDGSGFPWLLLAIGGTTLLLILFLVLFLLFRRKKKREEEEEAAARAAAAIIPPAHPYPQGQYMPGMQQGYGMPMGTMPGMGPGYPPYGGMPQRLMLPPGPPASPVPPPSPMGASAQLPAGQPAEPQYQLPAFQTEQGTQDLGLMALPPGPDPVPPAQLPPGDDPFSSILNMDFPAMGPGTPGDSPTPVVVPQAPAPAQAPPPAPLEIPAQGPEAPASPVQQAPVSPAPPPAPDFSPMEDLDAMLGAIGATDGAPPPAPEAPPVVPPATQTLTMQCHACGQNYVAEILELPALVSCPVCQTQGVINQI